MRKLKRSVARANLKVLGYRHINRRLYNPSRRDGESGKAYDARCAKSKDKSAFSLLWRDALAGKLSKNAKKALSPKRGRTISTT